MQRRNLLLAGLMSLLATCEANGIATVPGECPFMFFGGTMLLHRFHGLINKITGTYPR